jgi:hypothetical protein
MSDVIRAYESPSRVTMWHSASGASAAGYGVIEWNVNAKLPGFQSALESPVPGIKKSYAPSAYTILTIIAIVVGIVLVIVGAVLIANAVQKSKRMAALRRRSYQTTSYGNAYSAVPVSTGTFDGMLGGRLR